ncbi:gas vesicle protein GvpG [Nonomuraea sp. NPDC003804]|uniref:gas vesicle protein GvpG n=1 Tax=Nonomuraea sp. NPDC003804 TaxID=3154547 RepID=UPI0033B0027F
MGLLTMIVGLPLAPLKGLIKLAEVLRDEADRQLYDPAVAKRELEEIEKARDAGEISEEEAEEAMERVLLRITGQATDLPDDTEGR